MTAGFVILLVSVGALAAFWWGCERAFRAPRTLYDDWPKGDPADWPKKPRKPNA